MTLLALKAFGVTEVYVVDVMENRLAKAKELGAAGIINGKEQDAVEELMRATAGKGMDLCIDTAGSRDHHEPVHSGRPPKALLWCSWATAPRIR